MAHATESRAEAEDGVAWAPPRRGLAIAVVLVLGIAWALCAHALWHSTVPAGLRLPHVDVDRYFTPSFLRRSASFERFLDLDGLLAILALLVVLVVYARRGHQLMRESAAGRIGTGILLGMLGFAIVWLVQLPFGMAAVWWERRHHVSHQ